MNNTTLKRHAKTLRNWNIPFQLKKTPTETVLTTLIKTREMPWHKMGEREKTEEAQKNTRKRTEKKKETTLDVERHRGDRIERD